MKDIIHTFLFGLAGVMLIFGILGGAGWLATVLFGDGPFTDWEFKIFSRVLSVLFFGSAGIFHMLAYRGHKEKRQEWLKENGG
jgi:hypothetical protein